MNVYESSNGSTQCSGAHAHVYVGRFSARVRGVRVVQWSGTDANPALSRGALPSPKAKLRRFNGRC